MFSYLVLRGGQMARNEAAAAARQEQRLQDYIREAAGTSESAASELTKLAGLRDQGVIDDGEFARLKARIVG